MAEFSEDHVGKRVVARSGTEVGTVEDVRDGDLLVAVEPDAERETVSDLGWDGQANQDRRRLSDEYVSDITENTVRLRV